MNPGSTQGSAVDRRSFLTQLGLGTAMLLGPAAALRAQFNTATPRLVGSGGLPAHLTSQDPNDPNAVVPHSYSIASVYSRGDVNEMLDHLETFIDQNLTLLRQSDIPRLFAEREAAGQTPTTVVEMMQVFYEGLSSGLSDPNQGFSTEEVSQASALDSFGSLCIEGPESCIDVGCDDYCSARGRSGTCFPVPEIAQEGLGLEPCECVCNPKWYEVALLALVVLLLIATPGPDELAAIAAAASRLIVRAAPAVAVP